MLESVSHYVMPGESETETAELIRSLGLDGIENLIYGTTPSPSPFTRLTVGAHLDGLLFGEQKTGPKTIPG